MISEARADYWVVEGRIASPGKFEGEREWVPYYYELWNEGLTDEDTGRAALFVLGDTDFDNYPDMVGFRSLILMEDDAGFVRGELSDEETLVVDEG